MDAPRTFESFFEDEMERLLRALSVITEAERAAIHSSGTVATPNSAAQKRPAHSLSPAVLPRSCVK